MDAFLVSSLTVTLAEIGDKTQLLSLFLTSKFRNKWAIIFGILVATLLNHSVSAWFGIWLIQNVQNSFADWLIGGSFIILGIWLTFPDSDEAGESSLNKYGAFIASTILFFIAEIGDKTQVATVLLGAQFESVLLVTLGTTLGMLAANVPIVLAGDYLLRRVPLRITHALAATIFVSTGFWILFI
jgi:putative Ca2+/H+ antiporter (TMEM165/GDT1 family)